MLLRSVALSLLLTVAACKGADKAPTPARAVPSEPAADPAPAAAQPVPAGSAFDDPAIARFAIYHLPTPAVDPKQALTEIVGESYQYLHIAEREDDTGGPLVQVEAPPMADFAPPDERMLKYFGRGLSPEQISKVQGSEHAVMFTFVARGADRLRVARDAMVITAAVERRTHGLLWDEETRELFSRERWQERIDTWTKPAPVAATFFAIHSYRDGELVRMVTLGLAKLGLPDLVINQVAPSGVESMAGLINLVAQTLAEGGQVGEGGTLVVDSRAVQGEWTLKGDAEGKGIVTLALGKREEGDADNRLWEISFPTVAGRGLQELHDELTSTIFGVTDELVGVRHDDPALLAASARARAKLLAMKSAFADGVPQQERLLVKAPFTTDEGGHEWMWVEVLSWNGQTLSGLLENDPYEVSDLKAGARVEVVESSVFDYIHMRADGTSEGNETAAIIEQQQQAR